MLAASAENLGHRLHVIFDHDCQMKFDGKPMLLVKNHEPKKINVLIVKANPSGENMRFKSAMIRQFEMTGVKVINKELAVMRAKNKLRTFQTLSKANVPMPKTYVVSHADYIDDVISDMSSFPIILKAVSGSHGKGVSIIESKRGLKSIIEMITKDDASQPFLIQEYVKESKGKDIRVFIVGKNIVGAMERIASRKGEFRSNFHLGGRVRIADLSDDEKTVAHKAVKACGLDFAGVDIIRTKNGPKVLEVNANPGLEGITLATGRDIAGELIQYAVAQARLPKKEGNKKL